MNFASFNDFYRLESLPYTARYSLGPSANALGYAGADTQSQAIHRAARMTLYVTVPDR